MSAKGAAFLLLSLGLACSSPKVAQKEEESWDPKRYVILSREVGFREPGMFFVFDKPGRFQSCDPESAKNGRAFPSKEFSLVLPSPILFCVPPSVSMGQISMVLQRWVDLEASDISFLAISGGKVCSVPMPARGHSCNLDYWGMQVGKDSYFIKMDRLRYVIRARMVQGGYGLEVQSCTYAPYKQYHDTPDYSNVSPPNPVYLPSPGIMTWESLTEVVSRLSKDGFDPLVVVSVGGSEQCGDFVFCLNELLHYIPKRYYVEIPD